MSRAVELLCSRRIPQIAVLALMSVGFAGCSADTQTRLSQNSFSGPFSSQPETTRYVAPTRTPTPALAKLLLRSVFLPARNHRLRGRADAPGRAARIAANRASAVPVV